MPVDDPAGESTVVLTDQRESWFDSPTDVFVLVSVIWFLVFGGRLVLPALALQIQRSLSMMFFAGVALFALVSVVDGLLAVVVMIAAFGTALMAFPPVMQSYLIDLFEGEQMGGAFGLSRTVFILLGSAGLAVVGFGSEYASFNAVFTALSAGLLVAGVVLLLTMCSLGGD